MAGHGRFRRGAAAAALVGALSLSLVGCGDGGDKTAKVEITEVPLSALPPELLGMRVQAEPAVELAKNKARPYIEAVGLFSMRQEELLQATLQVSRFTEDAAVHDRQFRDTVASQIGSGTPQILRMGKDLVYVTAGRSQSLSVWFKDRTMYVLAVREEYPQPRALLRQALEIKA